MKKRSILNLRKLNFALYTHHFPCGTYKEILDTQWKKYRSTLIPNGVALWTIALIDSTILRRYSKLFLDNIERVFLLSDIIKSAEILMRSQWHLIFLKNWKERVLPLRLSSENRWSICIKNLLQAKVMSLTLLYN